MRKLSTLLLALFVTTLIAPCFQCVSMDAVIPSVNAMAIMSSYHQVGGTFSMRKNVYYQAKNCADTTQQHHKVVSVDDVTIQHSDASKLFPVICHFVPYHFTLSFGRMAGRSPPAFSELHNIPSHLTGIIIKRE